MTKKLSNFLNNIANKNLLTSQDLQSLRRLKGAHSHWLINGFYWIIPVSGTVNESYISKCRCFLLFKLTVHRSAAITKAGLPRQGGALHSGPLTLAFTPGRVSRVLNFCLISGWLAYSLENPIIRKEKQNYDFQVNITLIPKRRTLIKQYFSVKRQRDVLADSLYFRESVWWFQFCFFLCMALVNSGAWFQGLKPNGLQRDSGNQRIMTEYPQTYELLLNYDESKPPVIWRELSQSSALELF